MNNFDIQRKWTVRDLIECLKTMPQDNPVTLLDADSNYVIELFSVTDCGDPDEVTFFPCGYNEMRK